MSIMHPQASLLLDGSSPVLLLGAGASVTSGIPAAGATAEKAARWAWCREAGRSPEDIRIRRSDHWPWLCRQPWFSEHVPFAEQYPKIIEKLFGVRKQRRDFFERSIAPGVAPKGGYRALVRILMCFGMALWTPIGGPSPTPIDTVRLFRAGQAQGT
jgi:hypothetical protein